MNIGLELWGVAQQAYKRNVHDGTKRYLTASQKVGSQSAMSEENKEFEEHNLYKVQNVMTPTCRYHGNQSRYVTTWQLWVDIGKTSVNTQI